MNLVLGNASGDPDLAMAITDCMLPQWFELAEALEPIPLPNGLQALIVRFDETLPRGHFEQAYSGIFHYTQTGIDKPYFLANGKATELRNYLFDFVELSLERVDWPAETRQRVSEVFRKWRATLPLQVL